VDLVGIEPTTSSMPWKRAPSCATGPHEKRCTRGLKQFNSRLLTIYSQTRRHNPATGVILRDFSLEEPALSEVEGTSRVLSREPIPPRLRSTQDASKLSLTPHINHLAHGHN
jgi:hypothetical protein